MPGITKEKQEYDRKYRLSNKNKIAQRQAIYYKANKVYLNMYNRNSQLKRYGITDKQFEELLIKQHGVCAICQQPEQACQKGKPKKLCVDHSHVTKAVRGLLCSKCNQALGLLNDSPDRLRMGVVYLERNNHVS